LEFAHHKDFELSKVGESPVDSIKKIIALFLFSAIVTGPLVVSAQDNSSTPEQVAVDELQQQANSLADQLRCLLVMDANPQETINQITQLLDDIAGALDDNEDQGWRTTYNQCLQPDNWDEEAARHDIFGDYGDGLENDHD
jgi:hypothetical protein